MKQALWSINERTRWRAPAAVVRTLLLAGFAAVVAAGCGSGGSGSSSPDTSPTPTPIPAIAAMPLSEHGVATMWP